MVFGNLHNNISIEIFKTWAIYGLFGKLPRVAAILDECKYSSCRYSKSL